MHYYKSSLTKFVFVNFDHYGNISLPTKKNPLGMVALLPFSNCMAGIHRLLEVKLVFFKEDVSRKCQVD